MSYFYLYHSVAAAISEHWSSCFYIPKIKICLHR